MSLPVRQMTMTRRGSDFYSRPMDLGGYSYSHHQVCFCGSGVRKAFGLRGRIDKITLGFRVTSHPTLPSVKVRHHEKSGNFYWGTRGAFHFETERFFSHNLQMRPGDKIHIYLIKYSAKEKNNA